MKIQELHQMIANLHQMRQASAEMSYSVKSDYEEAQRAALKLLELKLQQELETQKIGIKKEDAE